MVIVVIRALPMAATTQAEGASLRRSGQQSPNPPWSCPSHPELEVALS